MSKYMSNTPKTQPNNENIDLIQDYVFKIQGLFEYLNTFIEIHKKEEPSHFIYLLTQEILVFFEQYQTEFIELFNMEKQLDTVFYYTLVIDIFDHNLAKLITSPLYFLMKPEKYKNLENKTTNLRNLIINYTYDNSANNKQKLVDYFSYICEEL
jgi:hypothetical protein